MRERPFRPFVKGIAAQHVAFVAKAAQRTSFDAHRLRGERLRLDQQRIVGAASDDSFTPDQPQHRYRERRHAVKILVDDSTPDALEHIAEPADVQKSGGGIGAVSVFKAVYIDKRDIKCACVGGSSKVPLGFVSLTENVMMVAMALWMTSMWL